MSAQPLHLWVFRENRRKIEGHEIKSKLLECLNSLSENPSKDQVMAALLRAGELECAVGDAGGLASVSWMLLTDILAEALVGPVPVLDLARLCKIAEEAQVPRQVEISPHEGFAYYALHPLAYAEVHHEISIRGKSLAVVGIRSIGSTLSAMAAAAARKRGIPAERITVRPEGHPYNRITFFSAAQLEFIRQHSEKGASFWVVDEGPGLSGSSFLSVGEALEAAGIPLERITLVCSHEPCFDMLRAEESSRRARRFHWKAVPAAPHLPNGARFSICGGEWRNRLFVVEEEWPASWVSFERLKYLSGTGQEEDKLLKFAGLGHYGEQVLDRESKVAAAGFGPVPRYAAGGFTSYPWIPGRPMRAGDLSETVVKKLANYCAARCREFPTNNADTDTLQHMAEHNLKQSDIALTPVLRLEHPVIVDGRMQPHEWLLSPSGGMLKTDSGAHGDDHFFPGPSDIAWDLAGAIVEWKMTAAEKRYFLNQYCAASHDQAVARVEGYVMAYAAFRNAYCRMASNALARSEEERRLESAAANYQAVLTQMAHSYPASIAA